MPCCPLCSGVCTAQPLVALAVSLELKATRVMRGMQGLYCALSFVFFGTWPLLGYVVFNGAPSSPPLATIRVPARSTR